MNILCNGGPIAAAERVAAFVHLHGLDPNETRRIHVGFSGGRFEFMNRPFWYRTVNAVEAAAWPALKGFIFREAAEIFCRLLRGDVISSADIRKTVLTRQNFRSDEDWAKVVAAVGHDTDQVEIDQRFNFEALRILPVQWLRTPPTRCGLPRPHHTERVEFLLAGSGLQFIDYPA